MIALFTVVLLALGAECHLNLYMNETETKRLLGIPGELYYVRSGFINDYALSFNIPIKSDVSVVYFDWQSLPKVPPEPLVRYSISLAVSSLALMFQPVLSIPPEGAVPGYHSVFSIALPCTGSTPGEVDIKIQINVTMYSPTNVTVLDLRRKKICLKDEVKDMAEKNHTTYPYSVGEKMPISSGIVFYIGVGCACATMLLVILISVGCCLRSKKSPRDRHIGRSIPSVTQPSTQDKSIYGPPSSHSLLMGSSALSHGACSSTYSDVKPSDVHNILSEIQISRNLVTLSDVFLEGTFGRVYRGTVIVGTDGCTRVQNVLVKTVTAEARCDQIEVMLREACLTRNVTHDHIATVMATCFLPLDQPPLIIYADFDGAECNLKIFLQHCKMSEILHAQQIVYIAIQIARGIQQLHRRRLLHRDIATRNCLVDSQLRVRVTDAALARDIFPHDYHCLGDNKNRPIKWLAVESLVHRRFSPASDMWSFGILLWELFTFGSSPYADVDPFEMASYLQDGYRVSQPVNCPNDLFAVMACCWCEIPDERPKFTQMQICLQDLYTALCRYV